MIKKGVGASCDGAQRSVEVSYILESFLRGLKTHHPPNQTKPINEAIKGSFILGSFLRGSKDQSSYILYQPFLPTKPNPLNFGYFPLVSYSIERNGMSMLVGLIVGRVSFHLVIEQLSMLSIYSICIFLTFFVFVIGKKKTKAIFDFETNN